MGAAIEQDEDDGTYALRQPLVQKLAQYKSVKDENFRILAGELRQKPNCIPGGFWRQIYLILIETDARMNGEVAFSPKAAISFEKG